MRGNLFKRGGRVIRHARRGAATVEMAVVTPLLLGMMFGIMEYGWVFMLQSSLTSAAREACRLAVLPGATDSEVQQRFQDAVAATGLTQASSPTAIDGYHLEIATSVSGNQTVKTVTVRVPWDKVSLVGGGLLPNPKTVIGALTGTAACTTSHNDMYASCSMLKEGT